VGSFGRDSFGRDHFSPDPFGQDLFGQDRYGQDRYGHGPSDRDSTDRSEIAGARRTSMPVEFAIAIGAVLMIIAGFVAAIVPASEPGWRFAVMAIAVGVFGSVFLDHVALAVVALIGFLISNGFLEDRFGQLAWHGATDVWRVLLLVMVGAWGLAIGEAIRFVREIRARANARRAAYYSLTHVGAPPQRDRALITVNEEEKHGA
jgi:hypothetical protein